MSLESQLSEIKQFPSLIFYLVEKHVVPVKPTKHSKEEYEMLSGYEPTKIRPRGYEQWATMIYDREYKRYLENPEPHDVLSIERIAVNKGFDFESFQQSVPNFIRWM